MPLKVAFIVGQLGLGGAEQQLYHLLSGLERSRISPVIITLGPNPDEYWVQPITNLGIPVIHVPRSLGRILRLFHIARILRTEQVEIVHAWVFHANPYSALAGRLARIPLRFGSMREAYIGLPDKKLIRWVGYRGLDILITNSAESAQQLQNFELTKSSVEYVPNGVSIPARLSPTERNRLKSALGFSDSHILIGSIGRLDHNKNFAMLIRVFATLAMTWPALRLVIIGEGPARSQLTAAAEEFGVANKVCLPGVISLASRYLPAMEVCCLTSYTEGMPNVIMEAAAAGLPVVSTDCGDSVNLIEHGVSGYLVSANDDTSMSGYLNMLLANPAQTMRMGDEGQEKMRREFSVKAMVARMIQIYEQALADK
jgi:glycosyltransferase involved in cell wall biosynthesis